VESTGDAHAEPVIALIHYTVDDIPDGLVLAAFAGNLAFPPHLLDVIGKRLSNLIAEKGFRFIQHIRADNMLIYFVRVHILFFPSFPA
jgi:hypothetical protein